MEPDQPKPNDVEHRDCSTVTSNEIPINKNQTVKIVLIENVIADKCSRILQEELFFNKSSGQSGAQKYTRALIINDDGVQVLGSESQTEFHPVKMDAETIKAVRGKAKELLANGLTPHEAEKLDGLRALIATCAETGDHNSRGVAYAKINKNEDKRIRDYTASL